MPKIETVEREKKKRPKIPIFNFQTTDKNRPNLSCTKLAMHLCNAQKENKQVSRFPCTHYLRDGRSVSCCCCCCNVEGVLCDKHNDECNECELFHCNVERMNEWASDCKQVNIDEYRKINIGKIMGKQKKTSSSNNKPTRPWHQPYSDWRFLYVSSVCFYFQIGLNCDLLVFLDVA